MVCRGEFPKSQLTRYVCPGLGMGDDLVLDETGKAQGRGFYLCRREECQKKRTRYRGWVKKCKGGRT
jgi:uncharacterized protein